MVDDGSTVDVLSLNAYKRMDPNSTPLYGFTGDHVAPKGEAKLTIMVGEHTQTSTALANFLVVDASSVINRIIGRPL